MIIDCHMHAFPFLGGGKESGWASAEEHVAAWQQIIYGWAGKHKESSKRRDINFRVGKYGRFEWTEDGEDYYFSFLPPSLQEMTSSPEFVLAQMEHVGVDMAVLQNNKPYGKLNNFAAHGAWYVGYLDHSGRHMTWGSVHTNLRANRFDE